MTLIARTAGGPQQTVGAIRGELKNLDPETLKENMGRCPAKRNPQSPNPR